VGIEIPKIEVRYENLSVEGDVYVGSRALPTLLNVTINTLEVLIFFIYIIKLSDLMLINALSVYLINLIVCMVECFGIVSSCTIQEERDSDSQKC
jgi:hypothetical protein